MKKSVRWIASAIVFIAIGIIFFLNLSEVLRRKSGGESDMIHSFYNIEENTLDVLCMGSSHGYSSFQPNTLWSEYGLTSYAMCSQRQTAASTYYLLQEALKYQKPKVLLLESYYFFTDKKFTDEPALRMGFDGMRFGKVKRQMVSDMLKDLTGKEKLAYYIPFLEYHSRWEELEDLDFHSKEYLKGGILDLTVFPMQEPVLPENGREIADVVYEYFEKIIALCEENNIQLVLYAAPYGYEKPEDLEGYLERQRVSVTLKSYLRKKDIPFLYYQKTNAAKINYNTDFRDYTHLNTNGAIKITKNLGDFLIENYELPDHRQDAAFRSWWEDYEQFQNDMKEVLSESQTQKE